MPRPADPLAPSLPPLDVADEVDELDDRELGTLLEPLSDLEDAEDDSVESHLDVGGDETDPLSKLTDDDGAVTDVGGDADDLNVPEDDALANEDAPLALDLADEIDPGEAFTATDDVEGPEEDFSDLANAELPALDADDAEGVGDADTLPLAWAVGDEPRPAGAARPFRELEPPFTLEPCSALALAEGSVVAASSDLLWFASSELSPLRLDAGSSRIHGLALVGSGWEYAVCSTTSGKLLRRGRVTPASEELRRVREAAELAPAARELFDLCQPGTAFPHALVVRTASGALLRSDDDGATFRRVTDRRIVALAPRGAPALALTAEGSLLKSNDGGGIFEEIELAPAARSVVSGQHPVLAAHGDLVVLGDPELGLAVSADGGRRFRLVPGTRGVTAVSAGECDGAPCAFAALYDEADDRSSLVRVPLTGAPEETIAWILPAGGDDEDAVERSRVARLEWDASREQLWVVGGFGVKVFAPPASGTDA